VAANIGIRAAFERELNKKVQVPEHYKVMGAIGAALLAKEEHNISYTKTNFRGFEVKDFNYNTTSFECKDCANVCEIVDLSLKGGSLAKWGDKCGKFSDRVEMTVKA
ncbi:MAG: 2-hydroxyglutaryl-CoA dehydratase, partial [Nitrospirae bacterium]|nr:2-hydroxyglutaryl-CoA dehydratase [Nitrospirota bacterium]